MGVQLLHFQKLSSLPVLHFISTRTHGVSNGPFSSLNLAFHVGDEITNVLINRTRLMDVVGIPLEDVVVGQQLHSANVAIVSSNDRGRGASSKDTEIPNTDALVTGDEGVCLLILVADCAPILLYDTRHHAIAAIHAGRAGAGKTIASKTIATMTREFGTKPEDVIAAIGPTIRSQHYQISAEKASELRSILPTNSKSLVAFGDTYFFDLVDAHIEELCAIGVLRNNIEYTGHSTYATPELFFSERRDGKPTGRIGIGIMLRNNGTRA